MIAAQAHTPARERHLRELAKLSTQLHRQLVSLGDTIRVCTDERRHAADNVQKIEKQVEWLLREQRFAGASSQKQLAKQLACAEVEQQAERERDQSLIVELDELRRQESALSEAQRRYGALVEQVLRAFGPAGQDVGRRLQGQA
jgi:hypothetical protein